MSEYTLYHPLYITIPKFYMGLLFFVFQFFNFANIKLKTNFVEKKSIYQKMPKVLKIYIIQLSQKNYTASATN